MALPHIGSWGTPDFGLTEWIGNKVGAPTTAQGGSDLNRSSQPSAQTPKPASTGQVQGAKTQTPAAPSGGGSAPTPRPSAPSGGRAITEEEALKLGYDWNNLPSGYTRAGGGGGGIDDAARAQEDAARQAAEAARQAARRKYEAQKGIAESAKQTARGQYDWIINELGSSKQDLLDKVMLNEKQGIENYTTQEQKTKDQYDKSRQEILSTYRDLNVQQEKLMRGSGQAQSSRSQEAQLRLNNLMGKDLSQISTNEADSLALIGNALTQFKENTLNTKNSIEREAKSKQDKASLDYDAQIKSIDNNMQLSENEREDAYAAAEAKLAGDIANVQTWAAGQKLEAQKTQAAIKSMFDDYIVQMTDANGLLNQNIGAKTQATNSILTNMGFTPMDTETDLESVSAGVYQGNKSYKSKEDLDSALASGQITPLEYSNQIASLQRQPTQTAQSVRTMAGGIQNPVDRITQQDPLLRAVFA